MPDLEQPKHHGDLSYILKESFKGNLKSSGRISIADTPAENFVVKLSGTASKDTYLTKATVVLAGGSQGAQSLAYLTKNTLLTGQVSKTVSSVNFTTDIWTTTTAHGFSVGDIIEVTTTTTGNPDINTASMMVVRTVPLTTTFTLWGIDFTGANHDSGTAIRRYAKSGETIIDAVYSLSANDTNNGGMATPNQYEFFAGVGQKITATEEFVIYQHHTNATSSGGMRGSGSLQGITVDTGADPTVV